MNQGTEGSNPSFHTNIPVRQRIDYEASNFVIRVRILSGIHLLRWLMQTGTATGLRNQAFKGSNPLRSTLFYLYLIDEQAFQ